MIEAPTPHTTPPQAQPWTDLPKGLMAQPSGGAASLCASQPPPGNARLARSLRGVRASLSRVAGFGLLLCLVVSLPTARALARPLASLRLDRLQVAANAARVRQRIPDVTLLDQTGKPIRFYSDLVQGRLVVVQFIFTSCNLVCPMSGSSFSRLQAALGERLGKDVYLISITTDPTNDTPARLDAWGARFGAKPGWTLATGGVEQIDKLLVALTGAASGLTEHSPAILVINDRNGAWIREYGLGDTRKLIEVIDEAAR
jgi:protein SCO1/2